MKKLLLLITGLLLLVSVEGQILRYSNYTAPTPPEIDSITALLTDGYTDCWYEFAEDNYTSVGDTAISQWDDLSGNERHLVQANALYQPELTEDGIAFSLGHLLKTGTFSSNQPVFIYAVIRQDSWVANEYIFTSYNNYNIYFQQRTATPNVRIAAGTPSGNNANMSIGTFYIVRILFNGASSKLQINNTTATTGDFGANAMDGLAIPSPFTTTGAATTIKAFIRRSVDDSGDDEYMIYNYLNAKYSLGLTGL